MLSHLTLFAVSSPSPVLDIFVAIGAIFGVIGVLGGASAYIYKGRANALIELQEKEIKALNDNNKTLKDQNEQMKSERSELLVEIKRMRTEIKTMRRLIQQPKQFNALAAKMAEQHSAVLDKLTDILVSQQETKDKK